VSLCLIKTGLAKGLVNTSAVFKRVEMCNT
jgi:hypothetical protein